MDKRGSGVLLHISSLASPYGIGDLGPEAYRFADFLAGTKQSCWQMLPLNPTDPANGNSPYFSCSAFAANPLLISFERLMDEGLLSPGDLEPVPEFKPGKVDYDAVTVYKIQVLDKAYENFSKKGADDGYESFCGEHSGWLEDYALFTALKTEYDGRAWSDWPGELRDRDPEALEAARKTFKDRIGKERFSQYVLFRQWFALKSYCNGKGISIIGDIPIYVSYDSADVWVDPRIFKLDENKKPFAVSGVPPDYFSATGQLWNNPVYRWDVLRESGYSWWIKRIAHTLKYFDIVRIDHFRGLVKYWEVPAGEETAVNGEWKEVPTYDFFDTLRGKLPDFPVIVEDLGVITPDVREAQRHYAFPGMKVLQFAFGKDDPEHPYLPHNYEKNCVAYTGTHDNNTLMGWLAKESSPEEKRRFLRYLRREETDGDINWETIRIIMMSDADTVVFPAQDILGLGESARMNQPREMTGNWEWRLLPGQITPLHAEKLLALTETSGRG
ncbi:MAG: 4-alpha-glucanotransferase [Candidatus Omnitrophota bacterium]|nr:4-alpha-glucanotransferase [Candidatus Omnitrophota bacterium]